MRNNYFDEDAFMFGARPRKYGNHDWSGGRQRAGRGDIGPIVLRVLREKPMHGYEIIRNLEERSHGMWRPSAGSIYPTLQLLEEQELVTSNEESGKKVYSLTKAGREAADESKGEHPWESKARAGTHFMEMRGTIHETILLLKDIAFNGNEKQLAEVKAILQETRDRLNKVANS
jgi:DNA-binding PadR family transcriptional regulator